MREAPEAPAPHWLVRTLPPRTNALPEKAPELARARGAPRATPAVLRFADAPPTDMLAQLEIVLVPKVPESMRLELFKTEVGAVSAAVLLQESGVYLAEPGELTAVCAQHRVGYVVKGVVSSPHSTLRRIVAEPQEADRLDRDSRLPLFYAQAGAPPGEVQLNYAHSTGWPQVVLTHVDGSTSKICVAVLLAAFELLVQRRGTASTRIALPAHPVLMRSPLRTSAYETYIFHSQGQDATAGRKRKLEEAIDLKGMEPGKAKGAVLSVWYEEGAEKVSYEGVVTSLSPKGLRVRFRGSDKRIYEVTSEDEWVWGGLPE